MDLSGIARVLRDIASSQDHDGYSFQYVNGGRRKHVDRSSGPEAKRRYPITNHRTALSAKARALRDLRVEAATAFPAGLISDPVFDMLLDLFIADEEGDRRSISDLLKGQVPATTKLRWLARLESDRLVERMPDTLDRRRFFITLAEDCRSTMRSLMEQSRLHVTDADHE